MAALKRGPDHREISGRPEEPRQSTKIKFGVFGKELIEKEVKSPGTAAAYICLGIGSASTLRSFESIDAGGGLGRFEVCTCKPGSF